MAGALKGNDSLATLEVNGNNIGPDGMIALVDAIKDNNNLRTLELSYNPIGDKGAKALIDVLKFDLKVQPKRIACLSFGSILSFRMSPLSSAC